MNKPHVIHQRWVWVQSVRPSSLNQPGWKVHSSICSVSLSFMQSLTVEFELRREIHRLQEYRSEGIQSFCGKMGGSLNQKEVLNATQSARNDLAECFTIKWQIHPNMIHTNYSQICDRCHWPLIWPLSCGLQVLRCMREWSAYERKSAGRGTCCVTSCSTFTMPVLASSGWTNRLPCKITSSMPTYSLCILLPLIAILYYNVVLQLFYN